ncbi:MAG: diguanylate cyclase [Candidatus Aureabacteria bacterium]|nr:diguanylate cyclase [Candidatus Auribacterota bacterium]
MQKQLKKRLFVVDSGKSCLEKILKEMNVAFCFYKNPEHILTEAREFKPDLILGDFGGMNQEDLVSQFRNNSFLSNIPIILCAGKTEITSIIRKINGNVNDYLVKPYNQEEVSARIERVLRRHEEVLNSNPLSHLPGNIAIKKRIMHLSSLKEEFAVIYLDLDNFKAYNDYYGYFKGDEVIRFVADLCHVEALQADDHAEDTFVGHIGGDDFVLIRPVSHMESFCGKLIQKFDEKITGFYSKRDRERGYIMSRDRKGMLKKFPLMSLTLAVVVNEKGSALHYGEISARGSEIKHYLKSFRGSHYLIDRRKKAAA